VGRGAFQPHTRVQLQLLATEPGSLLAQPSALARARSRVGGGTLKRGEIVDVEMAPPSEAVSGTEASCCHGVLQLRLKRCHKAVPLWPLALIDGSAKALQLGKLRPQRSQHSVGQMRFRCLQLAEFHLSHPLPRA
jgi:hypothetical protein